MILTWHTDIEIPGWFQIKNFTSIDIEVDNEEYISTKNKQLSSEDWKITNSALESLIGILLPKLHHKSGDRISLISINSIQKNLINCISNPRSQISNKACILLALISQVYGTRFINENFNTYIPNLLANINTKVAVIAGSASICFKLALCYSGLSRIQTHLLEILKSNIKNKAPLIRMFVADLIYELCRMFDKDVINNKITSVHIPNADLISHIIVSSLIDNHSDVRQKSAKSYQILKKYIDHELEKQLNAIPGSRKKLNMLLNNKSVAITKNRNNKNLKLKDCRNNYKNAESLKSYKESVQSIEKNDNSPVFDDQNVQNRISDDDVDLLFSSPNSKMDNLNISINEDIKRTKTRLFENEYLPISPNPILKFYMKIKEKIAPDGCIVHSKHDYSSLYKHNELHALIDGFNKETLEDYLTVFSERQADPSNLFCSCENSTEPFIRELKSKVLTELNINIMKIVLTTKLLPDTNRHSFYLKTLEHLDDLSLPEETRITLRNIISKFNEDTADNLLHSICEAQVLSKTLTQNVSMDSSLNSSVIKSLSELRDDEIESDLVESFHEYLGIDSLTVGSPQKYIFNLVNILKNIQNNKSENSTIEDAKWYACCICVANYVNNNPENVASEITNDLFAILVESFHIVNFRTGLQIVINAIKQTRIFDKSFKIFECLNNIDENFILPHIICLEIVIGNLESIKRENPEIDFKVEEEYFIDAFLNSKLIAFDTFGLDIKNSIYNLVARMTFVFGKYFLDDQRFAICSNMFLLKHNANEYLEKNKCTEIDIMLYD